MKNWKTLTAGFVAGALCMAGTTAMAGGTTVSAFLSGDITFKIDDKNVAADSNLPVLNYNSSVYVPIRFVADQLGATVDWDVIKRQVVIKTPEPEVIEKIVEKPVEKIVYVDKAEDPDNENKSYSSLPAKRTTSDYELSVTGVSRDTVEHTAKIYLMLENKGDYKVQLSQGSTKITVDGENIDRSKRIDDWDKGWYNDVNRKGDKYEGYILLEDIPENWKYMDIELKIIKNGQLTPIEETVEFNIRY